MDVVHAYSTRCAWKGRRHKHEDHASPLGLALGSLLLFAATVARAEPVYEYRSQEGRRAFTNVRSLAPSNVAIHELDLPSLVHLDLAQADAAELERINERLERAHRTLTQSAACRAAAAEGEVPWYRLLYDEHPHWVWVGALLCVLAALTPFFSRALPGGMWGRSMMIVLPMVLGVGLLGSTAQRMSSTLGELRATADACNGELEPASAGDRQALERRASAVGELQTMLLRRQQRMDARLRAATGQSS